MVHIFTTIEDTSIFDTPTITLAEKSLGQKLVKERNILASKLAHEARANESESVLARINLLFRMDSQQVLQLAGNVSVYRIYA